MNIDDDRLSFLPSWAIVGNPNAGRPFANIVATGKNAGSLDVSDLDDVLVLGKNISKLLGCCPMAHRTIDVL